MGEKMRKIIQAESNKEAERILEQVNQNPELQNVHAPDELHDVLFARIDELENSKVYRQLSDEDQELIELGKKYKKKKKFNKVAAAALLITVGLGAGGVTAMGGPDKVVEVVHHMMAGREQTKINSDDERVEAVGSVGEEEAYQKIEDEFGFYPVRLNYLPEGMEFQESAIYHDMQYINMVYQDGEENTLIYSIFSDYRLTSIGKDTEDGLVREYERDREETIIHIKEYLIGDNQKNRWSIHFEYQNISYFIAISCINQSEVENIIDHLYLP